MMSEVSDHDEENEITPLLEWEKPFQRESVSDFRCRLSF